MPTPRHLRRRIGIVLIAAAAMGLLLYGGDWLSLRVRIPRREPYGTVTVRRYYAVALKSKKTSYMFDEPQEETCVNSLFPHGGNTPCWYLVRHKRQRIDINAGPSGPWIDTP